MKNLVDQKVAREEQPWCGRQHIECLRCPFAFFKKVISCFQSSDGCRMGFLCVPFIKEYTMIIISSSLLMWKKTCKHVELGFKDLRRMMSARNHCYLTERRTLELWIPSGRKASAHLQDNQFLNVYLQTKYQYT